MMTALFALCALILQFLPERVRRWVYGALERTRGWKVYVCASCAAFSGMAQYMGWLSQATCFRLLCAAVALGFVSVLHDAGRD